MAGLNFGGQVTAGSMNVDSRETACVRVRQLTKRASFKPLILRRLVNLKPKAFGRGLAIILSGNFRLLGCTQS
jgi:hypothetical protein